MKTIARFAAVALAFALTLAARSPARAQTPPTQKVLFVNLSGPYDAESLAFFGTITSYIGAANATYVSLSGNGGQAAAALAANPYQQVWVFDLSSAVDNYAADWNAIAAWYAAHPSKHVICDGRSISSYWHGHIDEGTKLTQNFYYNLAIRQGGLVLATDDADYHTRGMDQLTAALDMNSFVGSFSLAFIPVDTANVLMTTPNNMGPQLYDDSSPSQTPFGLQPNGKVLHTLAWHSNNTETPGISTTIQGSLGVQASITSPVDGTCLTEGNLTLSGSATNGVGPYRYQWSSSVQGALGEGETLVVPRASLTVGTHTIRLLVTDADAQVDDVTIVIALGGQAQCAAALGCADGTREGFIGLTPYPAIASCGGAWTEPGVFHDGPQCDREAGNTGANKNGTDCNVEDLCAPGWHVCYGPDDINVRTGGKGCQDAVASDYPNHASGTPSVEVPPGGAFFVTRTSGSGFGNCDEVVNGFPTSFNDIFGCGNMGSAPASNCAPLNQFGHNECSGLDGGAAFFGYTPEEYAWFCNDFSDGTHEAEVAVKSRPEDQGGAMCCKDSAAGLPEVCDGIDNDADGLVDETDFFGDGSANDTTGTPCTVNGQAGAVACTGPGGWTCKPVSIDLEEPDGVTLTMAPSGTAVAPNGSIVTVRITGLSGSTSCTATVQNLVWTCQPVTGLAPGHYALEASVTVGNGTAKDTGSADIVACLADDDLPNPGCASGAPYCASVSGMWQCVTCDDTSSGDIDAGCNGEVPDCDPFTRVCGHCDAGELGAACAAVDDFCDEPTLPAVVIDQTCVAPAVVGNLDPRVEWQKQTFTAFPTFNQVMMTPVAGNLTDDNGDGKIDANDVPDVAFTAFTSNQYDNFGVVRVISGSNGAEIFSTDGIDAGGSGVNARPHASGGVALGDLDGNGRPELIVAILDGSAAFAVWEANPGQSPAFTFKWRATACGAGNATYAQPAIADVNGDGSAEVVFPGPCVVDKNGALVAAAATQSRLGIAPFAVDLDDDPQLEIVAGQTTYDLPTTGTTLVPKFTIPGTAGRDYAAVGDFDGDGRPEVVLVSATDAKVTLYDPDGATDLDTKDGWSVVIPDGGSGGRGGTPTVADFDGDGQLEIGVAAQVRYSVIDNDGTTLWTHVVQDNSSKITGSSVFDFDGDRAAEVVYADEQTLWIFDGKTGNTRASFTDHASGTLFEYPIILDVDNDGEAEIVVASNNYAFSGWTGITTIGSQTNSWAPARPVWNQHAYHISNVNDDLSIPVVQEKNWLKWNNFRAAAPVEGLAGTLPDLFVSGSVGCVNGCNEGDPEVLLNVVVGNRGGLDVGRVQIDLRSGSDHGAVVGSVQANGPGGGQSVAVALPVRTATWGAGTLWAVVKSLDETAECTVENNSANLGFAPTVPDRDSDGIPDVCDDCVATGAEVCDGDDNDCNGEVDDGCDDDGDGFCDAALGCGEGTPEICPNGCNDCSDDDGDVFPGASCDGEDADLCADGEIICGEGGAFCTDSVEDTFVEVCDGEDNDCNGDTDEGCDDDGDGYCDASIGCREVDIPNLPTAPRLFVPICPNGCDDCDDEDGDVYPGAACDGEDSDFCPDGEILCGDGIPFCTDDEFGKVEACNVVDDDCDGESDEGCDDDHDGFCDDTMACTASLACPRGCGDCDDERAASAPNGTEVCNGFDDDCDDATDEVPPVFFTCGVGACEADGATVCVDGELRTNCLPELPTTETDTTCDGIDDDCSGTADEDYVARPVTCGQCQSALATSCVNGKEVTPPCLPANEGQVCDGGACASAATCQAGLCAVSRIISCDDGNPCTSDSCIPATGCQHAALPNDTECSDRDNCTTGDLCIGGTCTGADVVCGPARECEEDGACNGATGVCDYPFINGCVLCDDDQTAPELVCPVPLLDVECSGATTGVALGQASGRDACSAVTFTDDRPAGFPLGLTTVTYTGSDAAGNDATCATSIEVVDTTPPTITCPEGVSVIGDAELCGAHVTLSPTIDDACDDAVEIIGVSEDQVFAGGTTEVHLTAVDASGNQASCTTTVTVTGLDAFEVDCEPEIHVVAPADFCGYPEAVEAQVTNQCQTGLTVSSAADSFPLGTSVVEFTASRGDGTTKTCTSNVVVTDETPPTVDCGIEGAIALLNASFTPSAADICGVTLTIDDVGCVRSVDGTPEPVTDRCQVEVHEGRVVSVRDAPKSEDGEVSVVYHLTATDPSGNTTELDCSAEVDPESLDHDGDGIIDHDDNCPDFANIDQADRDGDGLGDVCDAVDGLEAEGSGGCSTGPAPLALALLALALLSRSRTRSRTR